MVPEVVSNSFEIRPFGTLNVTPTDTQDEGSAELTGYPLPKSTRLHLAHARSDSWVTPSPHSERDRR